MAKNQKPEDRVEEARWASLTWGDLNAWAGSRSTSRGRAYQKRGAVEGLVFTETGQLMATVQGNDSYTTLVWLTPSGKGKDALRSRCTCPVGASRCKHAVAVIAEFLHMLAGGEDVPVCEDDDRLGDLAGSFDPDLESEDDEEDGLPALPKTSSEDTKIREYVEAKTREDLVTLVMELAGEYPKIKEQLSEKVALSGGNAGELLRRARRELAEAVSQPGSSRWSGGHTPDFSRFKNCFERLMELGAIDPCADLARELIEEGFALVGESHDEGDTARELGTCLPAALDAVLRCSWPGSKKLLFAIDASLADDYCILNDEIDLVIEGVKDPREWETVAANLQSRLSGIAASRDFTSSYRRDAISSWLADALKRCGRADQVLEVYRTEARKSGNYERLVDYLIEHKQAEEAEHWAKTGIEAQVQQAPGAASHLAEKLREIAERRKQWDIVAAHAAWQFFDHPAVGSFEKLAAAARKAGCEATVCAAARAFLESGKPPFLVNGPEKGPWSTKTAADWPLPVPPYLLPLIGSSRRGADGEPKLMVLIELAIHEKRLDDALRWYEAKRKKDKGRADSWHGRHYDDLVAEAVSQVHPERSLEIYARRIDASLIPTGIAAYETAAAYLRKVRPILKKLKREGDFAKVVSGIRERYRNRPKLMEILDTLEDKPIVRSSRR